MPVGVAELLNRRDNAALSRLITLVENDHPDAAFVLSNLQIDSSIPVVGITGPPGAGKSSLLDGLVERLLAQQKRIAIATATYNGVLSLDADECSSGT